MSVQNKDSGLKFGSNIRLKVNLSLTKLLSSQIRFEVPVQKELISRKIRVLRKIKGFQRELDAMMRGSNMGILPCGLSYYGHLGASCSSSIAVGTFLIGAMPEFIW